MAAGVVGKTRRFRYPQDSVFFGRFRAGVTCCRVLSVPQDHPAARAAAVRVSAPSLARSRRTWVWTVWRLRPRMTAISRSRLPSLNQCSTSRSRGVRAAGPLLPHVGGGVDRKPLPVSAGEGNMGRQHAQERIGTLAGRTVLG